jgi:galactonate dehydratase
MRPRAQTFVLGLDPFQIELITQRLVRDVYGDGGQIHMSAVSAIEIACWDISEAHSASRSTT